MTLNLMRLNPVVARSSGGERHALDYFYYSADLWLLGFSLHVAGGLIHLLLVVALVVLVINLVSGRRVA